MTLDDDGLMTPWPDTPLEAGEQRVRELRGGAAFARLLAAQRLVQDRLTGASLPDEVADDIAERLEELCAELEPHQVRELDRVDGWRPDLPGRGMALLPPFTIDEEADGLLRGRVSFTRFHLGGNGAAHGGTHPLLFDDLFGRVANHHQDGVARTASLTVDYRRVTPVGVELHFDCTLDRIDGRKRYCSGRLTSADGRLLSEASALFLRLMPGQA